MIGVEHPSPPLSSHRCVTWSLTNSSESSTMAMSIRDLVAEVAFGEFYLDDTTPMDSTPFHRVCLNNKHKNSRYRLVKNITSINRTRKWNFSSLRSPQASRNERPCQSDNFCQYRQTGWQNLHHSPPTKRGGTASTGVSNSINNNYNCYSLRSDPSSTIQIGSENQTVRSKRWAPAV